MCGICGIVGDVLGKKVIVSRMMKKIKHRGPDDDGTFDSKLCSLGNTRLAIIDVDKGKLPVYSENKNLVLVFNGEIYNYLELKTDLIKIGHRFKTNADSEVLLHLFEEHGVDCLKYLNGMFAFSIWNKKTKELFFARDRLGIKPFYYFLNDGCFVFASELKVLLASKLISKELDPYSIYIYLLSSGFAPPKSIVKNIIALEPGTYGIYKGNKLKKKKYWSLQKNNERQSYQDALNEMEFLLKDSIKKRFQSDVPVGVFLSGGLDSGGIAALSMKKEKINTFSIGFESKYKELDELSEAKIVANSLGTAHHEYCITENEFYSDFDIIMNSMDLPSGDIFNSWFVSKYASKKVKVALSGTGGDELFFGYPHFAKIYEDLLNSGCKVYEKCAERFKYDTEANASNLILDRFFKDYNGVYEDYCKNIIIDDLKDETSGQFIKTIHHHLLYSLYLKDIDSMSMAHSLEVRVPFLDHRLVQFAYNLNFNWLYKKDKGYKLILRDLLKPFLPNSILSAKKKGFVIPFEGFFKTSDMEEKIRFILSRDEIEKTGFLYYKMVDKIVNDFYSGKGNGFSQIMRVLPLQAWMINNL